MMSYKIWNKKDSINGVSAADIMFENKIGPTDGVFLVLDSACNVVGLELEKIIRGNNGLSNDLTIEEVADVYLLKLKQAKENQEKSALLNRAKQEEGTEMAILVATMYSALVPEVRSGVANPHLVKLYKSLLDRKAITEKEVPNSVLEALK